LVAVSPEDPWIFKLRLGSVPKKGLGGTGSFGQANVQLHIQDQCRSEISAVP